MHSFTLRRAGSSAMTLCLLVAIVFQTACGTLLHPERRGQTSGRIDPSIAILNGIGLLFFIVPGLIAFAVDFSTGAIYLPPDEAAADDEQAMRVVHMDPEQMTPERIAAVVAEHTGEEVSINDAQMRVLENGDAEAIEAELRRQRR